MNGRWVQRWAVVLVAGIACGAGLRVARAAVAGPHVDVVRQYDENAVQTNQVDISAFALTVAGMTGNVAAAFDAGRGGVINFDNGSFTNPMTIDAAFDGGDKLLRLTNADRMWSIATLGSNPAAGPISGANVSFNGAPMPYPTPYSNDFVFGDVTDSTTAAVLAEKVTSFGFTILDSTFNGAGNNLNFVAHFSDGSTQANSHTIPLGGNSRDTFFGWTAPSGTYLTHIKFTADNNIASDDWAFITSAIPEPGMGVACVVIGWVGAGLRRGRSRSGELSRARGA